MTDSLEQRLEELLRQERLEVDAVGGMLNLSRGSGSMEAKVNLDPQPFLTKLADLDERARRRRLAGYVRGIRHALLEPGDSNADHWEFTTAAGNLAMSLEVDSFVDGVEAAAGSPAWFDELDDDLVYVYLLELDMGMRVVTRDQFERWSASRDRVVEGARSMLYHKAQGESPTELEGVERVEQLRVGDGFDAARCLVLDDLFWGELDDSSRLAMPTPDDLYFVRDGTDAHVDALRRAAHQRFEEAQYPLSNALFRFERGKPLRV
ncbi:MAG: hypothetical protein ABEN55_09785 [Bradymonadaceae bacterium]